MLPVVEVECGCIYLDGGEHIEAGAPVLALLALVARPALEHI